MENRLHKIKEVEQRQGWDVTLKISYDSCGSDWEEGQCVSKITERAFFISKDTGFITEWQIDYTGFA